jgi:hypothetical protein
MNRQAVAQELVKVAKSLTADYGDVQVYLNVSNFFKTSDGKRMTAEQVEDAKKWLENSALGCQMAFEREVRAALEKRYGHLLESSGLELK